MAKEAVSKSKFKPRVLEFLRQVEQSRQELIITDRGRPVVKIVPYSPKPSEVLKNLKGSVLAYQNPTEPVQAEWGALQ